MYLHGAEVLLTALLLGLTLPGEATTAPAVPALEWHLTLTHAPTAWAAGADGHGIKVMVIDSGLDLEMARVALAGSVAPSYAVNPLHALVPLQPCPAAPMYTDTPPCMKRVAISNPSPYLDTSGHGSFVACEIACHGRLDGYYGIAPRAQLVVGKVLTATTLNTETPDLAQAIRWGALHQVAIESLSLEQPSFDAREADAIAFAQAHRMLDLAGALEWATMHHLPRHTAGH